MENIEDNSANKMESINIEESPASKMENIDTEKNQVSNKENFWTENIPLENMENIKRENNPSNHTENIDTGDTFLNNMQSHNTEHHILKIEELNGILNLILNQRKNIATLLQILESSIEIFESTTNYHKSKKGRISSPNKELSEFISRHFQKISTFLGNAKSHLTEKCQNLQYLDDIIKSACSNSICQLSIQKSYLVTILNKIELDTLSTFNVLCNVAELCRKILTDDPLYASFLFRIADIVSY